MNVDRFKIDKNDTKKLLGVKFDLKNWLLMISVTSVKEQVEKYLLWPELQTWKLERNAYLLIHFTV